MKGSLMATARGLVAVDRWALGEATAPDGLGTMDEVLVVVHPDGGEAVGGVAVRTFRARVRCQKIVRTTGG